MYTVHNVCAGGEKYQLSSEDGTLWSNGEEVPEEYLSFVD